MSNNGKSNNRRKNYLHRVLAVQELYRLHHKEGMSDIFIYRRYVYPMYYIGERTFRQYLEIPASRELNKIEQHVTENIPAM